MLSRLKEHIKGKKSKREQERGSIRQFYKINKKKNRTSVAEGKKDDLQLINSAKHYLDLKRIHEILPEKHCRQEYNTNVWSDVFQKYYSWKKSQIKKRF